MQHDVIGTGKLILLVLTPERGYLTKTPAFASDLPLALLKAEIARREADGERPECGSRSNSYRYNTALHVFALFLILVLSTLACSFPIIVRRFPSLPVPNYSLFLSRHFGTGVLIATGFVHLLPTAYTSLTDPCLPPFWNEVYPAMSGFIAMVSMMVVVGIEMFFAIKGAGHSHGVDFEGLRGSGEGSSMSRPHHRRSESFKPFRQGPIGLGLSMEDAVPLQEQRSPYSDHPGSVDKPLPPPPGQEGDGGEDGEDDEDLDLDELDPNTEDTQPLNGSAQPKRPGHANGHLQRNTRTRSVSFASITGAPREPSPHEQRAVLQCLLLEAGILFHSIFIGLALSVSTGPAFIVLLIAISFHQTFEGLALGSRIAAISSFSTTSPKPWLMSFLYGVTTPIGQAIGLAVHTLYDPASQFGLLTV
jgi:solute carrier family 39 (zinc transporter), member 1/2/3